MDGNRYLRRELSTGTEESDAGSSMFSVPIPRHLDAERFYILLFNIIIFYGTLIAYGIIVSPVTKPHCRPAEKCISFTCFGGNTVLKKVSSLKLWAREGGVCLFLCLTGPAIAAPLIVGTSGTFSHESTVTISGSGFGTKGTAAPVVWDDASGASISSKWNLTWPNTNPTYNMAYRSPQRGISLPHNNITRYLAGAHAGSGGANGGGNVAVWKNRTISSYPAYTYASWYQRSDNAWVFGGDDNYKVFDFSRGNGGYDLPYNWYLEYNERPTSRTNTPDWHILDDAFGQSGASLDGPTSSWWQGPAVNPMSGVWSKIELEIKYTNQADGYIKLWENGVQRVNYTGHTDRYSTTQRSEGIGGYARQSGQPNNWRYFADIYLDYSRARMVLANNPNLALATIIEPQIPSSWNAGSISATVNLGKFTTGQAAFLFVFDPAGVRNTVGFPITVDSSGSGTQIPAPVLRVQ